MVKGVTKVTGLRDIRTMHGSKKRSIPRVQSSTYLDLYILQKEKSRLEKELNVLDKRKNKIQKRVDEINTEMDNLEKEEALKQQESPQKLKKSSEKNWKRMSLKY